MGRGYLITTVSAIRREREWQNPESLARRILNRDAALQWVTVLNGKGDTLAHVYSESYTKRVRMAQQTRERLGVVDTVFLGAATKAERWYGKMEFILLAYRKAKVMLIFSERYGLYFAVKIPRSAMAEHLYPKVRPILAGPRKA